MENMRPAMDLGILSPPSHSRSKAPVQLQFNSSQNEAFYKQIPQISSYFASGDEAKKKQIPSHSRSKAPVQLQLNSSQKEAFYKQIPQISSYFASGDKAKKKQS